MSNSEGGIDILVRRELVEEAEFRVKEGIMMLLGDITEIVVNTRYIVVNCTDLHVEEYIEFIGDCVVGFTIDIKVGFNTSISVPFVSDRDISGVLHPDDTAEMPAVVFIPGAAESSAKVAFGIG